MVKRAIALTAVLLVVSCVNVIPRDEHPERSPSPKPNTQEVEKAP